MRSQKQSPQPKIKSVDDQLKQNVYKLIIDLYPKLVCTKIKDVEMKYSIYYAKIRTRLTIGYRYIVVIVPADKFIAGTQHPLSVLPWISFQTRVLNEEYKLTEQPHSQPDKGVVDYCEKLKFHQEHRDETQTYYRSNVLNCELLLLHNPKNPSASSYPPTVDLKSALDSFMCCVNIP